MSHTCSKDDVFEELAESYWHESDKDAPEQLFHYCPTQSALNIVPSGKMWASAFECMNDEHEFRYGLNIALDEVSSAIKQLSINFLAVEEFIKNWQIFINQEIKHPRLRLYILSFSAASDNQYLWQNYADQHTGMRIEFKNNQAKKDILKGCFVKVSYEAATTRKILQDQLTKIIDTFNQNTCVNCLNKNMNNLSIAILQTIFFTSASLKHEKWSPEQEWRMVFFGHAESSPNSTHGDIKFRSRESQLVDYLEIDLCKAGLQLNSMISGKNQEDSSKNSLELFKKRIQIK